MTTDGFSSYAALEKDGVTTSHHAVVADDKKSVGEVLPWVHIAISNAKRSILDTYHDIKAEFLQLYLNEFCYKFNRRYLGFRLFDRLELCACTYRANFNIEFIDWQLADIHITISSLCGTGHVCQESLVRRLAKYLWLPNGAYGGEADFCGGLSDGKTGLAGFRSIYRNDGLDMSARKGYFFLDGRIVCLGSDIQAAMSDPINTAVEQCLAEGDAVYSVGGSGKQWSLPMLQISL